LTGILRGKVSDTRPVQRVAALRQQRQESIAQQACHRRRHAVEVPAPIDAGLAGKGASRNLPLSFPMNATFTT
jgi:hypothetical protein